MKVEMTRDTFVAGKLAEAGKTVEASARDARYLVAIGKANSPAVEAEKAEAAEATIATAVPGGKRGGRKAAKK